MNSINIYNPDQTLFKSQKLSVDCYYRDALQGDESIELKWEDHEYCKLPVGCYVEYNNRTYRLTEPHEPSRRAEDVFTYNPVFYAEPYHWHKAQACFYEYGQNEVQYSDTTANNKHTIAITTLPTPTSRELDWSYKGNLPEAFSMVLQAIKNETGATWNAQYGTEIATKLVEIQAQGLSIYDFISEIANQCGKEYYFDFDGNTPTICVGTLEREVSGEHTDGHRVIINVGEDVANPQVSSEAEEYFTRFYFFGSTRNIVQPTSITKSSVINRRLPLCNVKHNEQEYNDMKYYEGGFIDINVNESSYTDRKYIPNLPPYKIYTKSVFFDDIYPHSDLKIKSVTTRWISVEDEAGNVTDEIMPIYYVVLKDGNTEFQFNPTTYDPNDNPSGHLLPTLMPSIAFRSGYLQGLEYELIYHQNSEQVPTASGGTSGYVTIPANSFEIVFDSNSNPRLPNNTIKPQDNDECTLFNIHMPDQYIWTAQKELETESLKYIDDLNVDKNTYTLESNPVKFDSTAVFKPTSLRLGTLAKLVYPNGEVVLSRVVAVERHMDIEADCKITLGYKATQGTLKTLREVVEDTSTNVETVVKEANKNKSQIIGLRNGYRAQKETLDMVFDTDGYFDTDRIRPASIETGMIAVGQRSQQFTLSGINFSVAKYNSGHGVVKWTAGSLVHFSIHNDTTDQDEVKTWTINANTTGVTLSSGGAYYVYAKANRTNYSDCSFAIEQVQRKFDSDSTYWYFLVGIINSEQQDGNYYSRIMSMTYGSTTITGRQITTGVIRSSDPNHGVIINLDDGTITGNIVFQTSGSSYDQLQTLISGNSTVATASQNASDAVSTATNAQNAVNNLEVGGRNLLLNSSFAANTNKWTASGAFNINTSAGYKCAYVSGALNVTKYIYQTITSRISTTEKTIFTYSGEIAIDSSAAKGTTNCFVTPYYSGNKNGSWYGGVFKKFVLNGVEYNSLTYGQSVFNIKGLGFMKFAYTFEVEAGVTGDIWMYARDFTGTLYFRNLKLEKGTKPTDWTPAPEDTEAELTALQTDLQGQIDQKIETFYQTSDPSTGWTAAQKTAHTGDLWYYTGSTSGSLKQDATYRWSGSAWVEQQAAKELFDKIDGKSAIWYNSTATGYNPTGVEDGDFLVLNDGSGKSYRRLNGAWVSVQDYQAAIANIQIGGRNFLLGSDYSVTGYDRATGLRYAQSIEAESTLTISFDIEATNVVWSSAGTYHRAGVEIAIPKPSGGYQYFGCWWAGTGTYKARLSNTGVIASAFTAPSSPYFGIYIQNLGSGTIVLKNFKLEKGNKATDWTPAPEDGDPTARAAAQAAQDRLTNIDSNSVFSMAEKQAFRPEWYAISGIADTVSAMQQGGTAYAHYYSINSAAANTRGALNTAFNNLRLYLKSFELYTNSDRGTAATTETYGGTTVVSAGEAFSKSKLSTLLAAYYKAELDVEFYAENVGKLVGTCATTSGRDKDVICPELTADMLCDPDMRMTIKFAAANENQRPRFTFRNTAGGAYIYPSNATSGASNSNYHSSFWYEGVSVFDNNKPLYWLAEQEIELKFHSQVSPSSGGGTNLPTFEMTDENNFRTIMTYSKAIKGTTTVAGGLILTQLIQAGDGAEQAGISGIGNVAFWAGGSEGAAEAMNVPIVIMKDGNAKLGVFQIDSDGRITMKDANGVTSALSIYKGDISTPPASTTIVKKSDNSTAAVLDYQSYSGSIQYSGTGQYSIPLVSTVSADHNGMAVHFKDIKLKVYGTQGIWSSVRAVGVVGQTTTQLLMVTYQGATDYEQTNSSDIVTTYINGGTARESIGFNIEYQGLNSTIRIEYSFKAAWYHDSSSQKVEIGGNGLISFRNQSNFFRAFTDPNTGEFMSTMKGKTSIPGVLWAGYITSSGSVNTYYANGEKYSSSVVLECSTYQSNRYTITHKLGTQNFSAIATPQGSTTGRTLSIAIPTSGGILYVYASAQTGFMLTIYGAI